MAIKKRIFFGFSFGVICIIITSCIAIFSLDAAYDNFQKIEFLNNKVSLIVDSDDIASDLKRNVSVYVFTGHESTYKNIIKLLGDLSVSIDKFSSEIEKDIEVESYASRMKNHLNVYENTFNLVVKEFQFKNDIINKVLPEIFNKLEQSSRRNEIIEVQNLIWTYLNSPNGKLSRQVFNKISNVQSRLKNSKFASDSLRLNDNFLRLTQATRSYLYLTSVVMAGEASEMNYVSNKMKKVLIENTTKLKQNIQTQNQVIKFGLIFFLLFSIFVLTFISWLISAGITRPLSSITKTLEQIVSGDIDIVVPGQDRKDEIGTLSKAADIFRERTLNLENSNEELSQFAYRTSHDLKAPLLSIIGIISIIEEDLVAQEYEEVKQNLKKILLSAINLDKLIDDILNLSKVNYLEDSSVECDLYQISQKIESNLENLLTNFEVSFNYETLKGININCNKIRLEQILENLISNSIKYSDPSKLNRFVDLEYRSIENKHCLSVKDNGLGIEKKYLSDLFGMFKRFHGDTAFGSGLGLYLVKKHLSKLNANIEIESESKKGSSFFIYFND